MTDNTPVFSYDLKYKVTYHTKQPLPISEVIKALQALDILMKDVPKLTGALLDVPVVGGNFYVESIESGSLIEELVVKLLFKDQAGLDAFIKKITDDPMLNDFTIGIVVALLVAYGAKKAYDLFKKDAPAPVQHQDSSIHITNSNIIQIGADTFAKSPEQIRDLVEEAVSNKKKLVEGAMQFLSPAKTEKDARVTIDGLNRLDPDGKPSEITFPSAAVQEVPESVDWGRDEHNIEFDSVLLSLRAHDLDSEKKGWAGTLDGVDGRLRIELDPYVDRRSLFHKSQVRVRGTLTKRTKGNKLEPHSFFVREVLQDADTKSSPP